MKVMFDRTLYAFAHGHAFRRRGSISHSRAMRKSMLIFCSLDDEQRREESSRSKATQYTPHHAVLMMSALTFWLSSAMAGAASPARGFLPEGVVIVSAPWLCAHWAIPERTKNAVRALSRLSLRDPAGSVDFLMLTSSRRMLRKSPGMRGMRPALTGPETAPEPLSIAMQRAQSGVRACRNSGRAHWSGPEVPAGRQVCGVPAGVQRARQQLHDGQRVKGIHGREAGARPAVFLGVQ